MNSGGVARKTRRARAGARRDSRRLRPFGSPDGSNTNLQELIESFVEIRERGPQGALATPATDHSARVLVGKMGVGKTVYLRRFQAAASYDDALYADDVRRDIPSTADVVRVCQQLLTHEVDEVWDRIWRRATCRGAISHLLCSPDLRERPESVQLAAELEDFPRLVPELRTRRSIYNQVQDIIERHSSRAQLRAYVFNDAWADIENLLADALSQSPPLCFYLDSVDDEFSRAPMFWLKCQRGLLTQIIRLLEDSSLRRVHVVACLRDVVLSDVLSGTHAGRYRNAPHIRVLDWGHSSIRTFLHAKIERLDQDYLLRPGDPDPVRAWLGRSQIYNKGRQVQERVEDYLLRHTRLIPRDVVALGNIMSEVVARANDAGRDELSDDEIRAAVSCAAKGFAEQQLTVCADQIAADMIPEHGATAGYDSFYTGRAHYTGVASTYGDSVVGALIDVIAGARRDRVGRAGLEKLDAGFGSRFGDYEHVIDVLWQNGLIGYRAESREGTDVHFFTAAGVDDFRLPRDKGGYAFHPCLAHRVALAPAGPPVRGFSPE